MHARASTANTGAGPNPRACFGRRSCSVPIHASSPGVGATLTLRGPLSAGGRIPPLSGKRSGRRCVCGAIHTSIKGSFPESEKSREERTRTVSLSTVVSVLVHIN